MDEKQRHDNGIQARREVLGSDYVDRSIKNRNDFNGEFQEMISRYEIGRAHV